MANVFISYPRNCPKGPTRAAHVRSVIERDESLNAWLDVDKTAGSQDWKRLIEREIRESELFILVLTPGLVSSRFVPQEIEWAKTYNVPIVPIRFNVALESFRNVSFYKDIVERDVFDVGERFDRWEKDDLLLLIQRMVKGQGTQRLQATVNDTGAPSAARSNRARAATHGYAFVNFRGGVGKTTLCALAGIWQARAARRRVLLIDLDPQENLSDVLGAGEALQGLQGSGRSALSLFEPFRLGRSVRADYDNIVAPISADALNEDALCASPETILDEQDGSGRLDLLAGDHRMSKLAAAPGELHTVLMDNFRRTLDVLRGAYDIILIDSGPAATLLSRSAINAAETIVAPTRAQHTSTRGLVHMMEAARTLFGDDARDRIRPVFNMARRHVQYERDYLEMFADDPGKRLSPELAALCGSQFQSVIPLAATMTDPMRVIGQILKQDGDLQPLGVAQAAVEGFCAELSPPNGLSEPHRPASPAPEAPPMNGANPVDAHASTARISSPNAPGDAAANPPGPGPNGSGAINHLRRLVTAKNHIDRFKTPHRDGAHAGQTRRAPGDIGDRGRPAPRRVAQELVGFSDVTRSISLHMRNRADTGRYFLDTLERGAVLNGAVAGQLGDRSAEGYARWLLSVFSKGDALKLVQWAGDGA